MLYYNNVEFSEGIDINKSDVPKGHMIFHYGYFENIGYKFELYVCYGCHDISMMAYELENIAIPNVQRVDYRCVMWNMMQLIG